mmetsp:Transcript_6162/g.12682  ORF Transcript_6162/g.12682 Transcript_6162/m.12682 type:complete len:236 (+) Transcript_6162:106-813(+)
MPRPSASFCLGSSYQLWNKIRCAFGTVPVRSRSKVVNCLFQKTIGVDGLLFDLICFDLMCFGPMHFVCIVFVSHPIHIPRKDHSQRLFLFRFITILFRKELVHHIILHPAHTTQCQTNAQGDGESGKVDKGKGFGTDAGQVVLVGKIGPVTGKLHVTQNGHGYRKEPKGQFPQRVGNDARLAGRLDFGQQVLSVIFVIVVDIVGLHVRFGIHHLLHFGFGVQECCGVFLLLLFFL